MYLKYCDIILLPESSEIFKWHLKVIETDAREEFIDEHPDKVDIILQKLFRFHEQEIFHLCINLLLTLKLKNTSS